MPADERLVRLVAHPGVGVQERVAQVLVRRAVELVGATLGHHADQPGVGTAILGRIVGAQHLHLRGGVDVRHADRIGVSAGAHLGCAVERRQRVLGARSVHMEAVVRREVERGHGGIAHHARLQLGEILRIAAVQLDALDLLSRHQLPDRGRLRLQRVGIRLHRNVRARFPGLQLRVISRADVRVHVCALLHRI